MRICLIFPKIDEPHHEKARKSFAVDTAPDQELLQLAGFQSEGISLSACDDRYEELPLSVDIGVVIGDTPRASRMYAIARELRRRGARVILGGAHARALPEEARPWADSLLTAWAPSVWGKVLDGLKAGRLAPEYSTEDIASVSWPPAGLGLFGRHSYENKFGFFRPVQVALPASTGPEAGTQKLRPLDDLMNEIDNWRHEVVQLRGEGAFADPGYARHLLAALAENEVQWIGHAGSELLGDSELPSLIARSGCRLLVLNLMSLNPEFHRNHGGRPEWAIHAPRVISKFHEEGVRVFPRITVGYDEDGPGAFEQAYSFLANTDSSRLLLSLPAPYPGSPLFEQWKTEGRLLHQEWEKYDGTHVVFRPRNLPAEALQGAFLGLCRKANRYSFRRMIIMENV